MVGLIDSALRSFLQNSTIAFVLSFAFFGVRLCQAQEVSAPTIKVDVSRVSVSVIATDKQGKFVGGLRKSDFHIFDNGVEQPIAGFLANDDPAQVVLMLECGPSMYFFGKESIQKADALITNLSANDRVAIVCYSSGAAVQFELSEDKSAARLALRELNFHLGFADLNLSKSLLEVLSWLSAIPGKKTVVLIGSGVDSSPRTWKKPFEKTSAPATSVSSPSQLQSSWRNRPSVTNAPGRNAPAVRNWTRRSKRARPRYAIWQARPADASTFPDQRRISKGPTPKSHKSFATNTISPSPCQRPTANSTPSPSPRTTYFA